MWDRTCVNGNASDHGIFKFTVLAGEDVVKDLRSTYRISGDGTEHPGSFFIIEALKLYVLPLPGRVPFNSKYKFAASLCVNPDKAGIIEVRYSLGAYLGF